MPNLELTNLPDDAEVERVINTFDNDDCAYHLHTWRQFVIDNDVDMSPEQNRAMILVSRRIRALRENSKGGKKKKPTASATKTTSLQDLL